MEKLIFMSKLFLSPCQCHYEWFIAPLCKPGKFYLGTLTNGINRMDIKTKSVGHANIETNISRQRLHLNITG